jgi:SagB-type dehydrogenase family enzyme
MPANDPAETVRAYHHRSKHRFERYAAGPDFMDWSTQPDPFRRFAGAEQIALPLLAGAEEAGYGDLFPATRLAPRPPSLETLGLLLELSFGLSAWKAHGGDRWALRCNPSSGNLHPTEAYLVAGSGVADVPPGIYHYQSHDHVLERRCRAELPLTGLLVGLSSVHWREAWKYGERAYRYCQHDAGHALGALSYAAALPGWRVELLEPWGDDDIAALLGIDRSAEFPAGEGEAPDLLCRIVIPGSSSDLREIDELVAAARGGEWFGQANALSGKHRHHWPAIEEVHGACFKPRPAQDYAPDLGPPENSAVGIWNPLPLGEGRVRAGAPDVSMGLSQAQGAEALTPTPLPQGEGLNSTPLTHLPRGLDSPALPPLPPLTVDHRAAELIKQRRSAQAFDGATAIAARAFYRILDACLPRPDCPPFDAWPYPPRVHLLLFVHRVEGLAPGLYLLARRRQAFEELKQAMRAEFLWSTVEGCPDHIPLFHLVRANAQRAAIQLSCHQQIAGASAFSLGMLAEFDAALEQGHWMYRRLFWECGLIGQCLYLEAEAAGVRGTGIGCFFDDPVHELVGLTGNRWQSLYHFTIGGPVVDDRLQTLPPYGHLERAP